MNRDAKIVAEWVRQADGVFVGVPTPVRAAADRLTSPKRRPSKRLDMGRMKPTSADLNQRTRDLRAELLTLTGQWCERCGLRTEYALGHMHHLRGGNGRRRQEQNINNVAWICGDCHEALHREPHQNRDFAKTIEMKRQAHPEHARRETK